MDISLDEIMQLSSEELYQKYKELFDSLYYTNDSFQITLPEYKKIVIEAINNSKIEYNGKISYILYLKKRIIKRIKQDEIIENTNSLNEYIKDINKIKPITEDEEKELLLKASNGDKEAKNVIVEHYLRLVISMARRYANKSLSFEDLIQEGNFGLMKAIEKFDPSMGYRFSTYATWWIRQSISRAIADKGSVVRLPVHLYEKVNLVRKATITLEQELKRKPTTKEIANYLRLSEKVVNLALKNGTEPCSLNDFISEEESLEYEDVLQSNDSVEDKVILKFLKDDINKLFDSKILTEREKEVLKLRYGFYDNSTYILGDVSKIYGVTGERIRQIEENALKKLRKSKIIYEFLDYMDSPQKAFNNINKMSDGIKDNTVKDKKHYFEEVSFDDKYGIVETKKVKSIYSYFNKYSRAKINIGIGRLDLLDQFYLYFRYGGKLDIPDAFALTMNQKEYFDNNIIPKLSEILKNINKESNYIPSDVMSLSNETFTKDDLNKMRLLLDKYKKSGINYYLSINQFFIKVLREGYINDKVYTKEDIMSILHLDSIEYDYCLSDVKEIYEDKKTRENIIKKLKKI